MRSARAAAAWFLHGCPNGTVRAGDMCLMRMPFVGVVVLARRFVQATEDAAVARDMAFGALLPEAAQFLLQRLEFSDA